MLYQNSLELTSRPTFATADSHEQSLNSSCLRVTLVNEGPLVTPHQHQVQGWLHCIAQFVFRTPC